MICTGPPIEPDDDATKPLEDTTDLDLETAATTDATTASSTITEDRATVDKPAVDTPTDEPASETDGAPGPADGNCKEHNQPHQQKKGKDLSRVMFSCDKQC